ncbi:Ig-like domain-containing protein [Aciduricibacillus chroicocephali]|uniref:Ig-like domain-containing protein n=1 Tax=Aciduricibacillus chroicocephali TaxID=3054939 RepID=A0ABY9KWE9_9BACI|nr:Ig-like domain-containing protein [Bacillaceae bacterium 44XB]
MKKKLLISIVFLIGLILIQPLSGLAASKFQISVPKKTMEWSAKQKIKVTGAGKTKVTYTSSKTTVATVDSKGNIKAVGLGTVKISAKAGKKKSTVTVKVVNKVRDISISLPNNTVYFNSPNAANAVINTVPSKFNKQAVSYSIANPKLAKVDQNGYITALKEGKTTLTIKAFLFKKDFPIKVRKGKVLWAQQVPKKYGYKGLSWSQDDSLLAFGGKVLDTKTGNTLADFGDAAAEFYSEGLAVANTGKLSFYNNEFKEIKSIENTSFNSTMGEGYKPFHLNAENNIIYTNGWGIYSMNPKTEDAERWHVYTAADIEPYELSMNISPDKKTFMAFDAGDLILFDAHTGEKEQAITNAGFSRSFEMSQDGKKIALAGRSWMNNPANIRIIDKDTQRTERQIPLEASDKEIGEMTYSPNGKYFAVGGSSGSIYVYKTDDYSLHYKLTPPFLHKNYWRTEDAHIWFNGIHSLKFSKDGSKIAAYYQNNDSDYLVVWNVNELK